MLPTDLRKHGVGARCSDNLATLGPADVAMMEMGTGRRNWSSGIKGSRFSPTFSVLVFTPRTGQSWKAGKDGGRVQANMWTQKRKRQREREEQWSVALTVVTDVEFSTKLCQKPSCQSEVSWMNKNNSRPCHIKFRSKFNSCFLNECRCKNNDNTAYLQLLLRSKQSLWTTPWTHLAPHCCSSFKDSSLEAAFVFVRSRQS